MIAIIKIEALAAALASATGHDEDVLKQIVLEHKITWEASVLPEEPEVDERFQQNFQSLFDAQKPAPELNITVLGGPTIAGFQAALEYLKRSLPSVPESVVFYLSKINHEALRTDILQNYRLDVDADACTPAFFSFGGASFVSNQDDDYELNCVYYTREGIVYCAFYNIVPKSDMPSTTCKGFHARKLQRATDYLLLNNDPFYQNNLRKQDMKAAYEQSNFDSMLERNAQTAIAVMEKAYTEQRMSKKDVPTSVLVNMQSAGSRTLANGFTLERELDTTGSIETNATSKLSRVLLRDYVQTLRGYRIWL